MSHFYTHYVFLIGNSCFSCNLRIHISCILLDYTATHSVTYNIQKRQNTGLRIIYNILFKGRKISPTRATCINNSGYPNPLIKTIRHDAAKTITIHVILLSTGKNMSVNINQTRCNI